MIIPLDRVHVDIGDQQVHVENHETYSGITGQLVGTYNPDDYKGKATPTSSDQFWLQVNIPLTAEQYQALVETFVAPHP